MLVAFMPALSCCFLPCCCSDEVSYLVLLEAVLLLLVCCSTQLYTQQTAAPLSSQPLLEALMEQQQSAAALVGALLQLVVARQPLPPKLQLYAPAADGSGLTVLRLVRNAAGGQMQRGSGAADVADGSSVRFLQNKGVVMQRCCSAVSLVSVGWPRGS
jgi:hypothetical protein